MNERGFTTKGSAEYFAEREQRIGRHIDEAKSKIEEIEARVRGEIAEISARRATLRMHLEGFVTARNEIVERRDAAIKLIGELEAVIGVCDNEIPGIDAALDELQHDYGAEDQRLDAAETSRHRQLRKHERKKTRFEGRLARVQLRKSLFLGPQNGEEPTS